MAEKGAAERHKDLYGLPLEEFTGARDELAKALRRAGDREGAERVKALRKPTVAAWTVNQLARRERRDVEALLEHGEELREAQREVLGGGGTARLERAAGAERQAVGRLVERARALLGERASDATIERVRETLHAASADEEVARELREGTLTRERRAAGLGLTGIAPRKRPAERDGRGRKRQSDRAKVTRAREREHEAREQLREAERELAAAERALAQAQRSADRAGQAVERRRKELSAAAERVREMGRR
jgi:hypothetical protein